jgi:hypothetical protein
MNYILLADCHCAAPARQHEDRLEFWFHGKPFRKLAAETTVTTKSPILDITQPNSHCQRNAIPIRPGCSNSASLREKKTQNNSSAMDDCK